MKRSRLSYEALSPRSSEFHPQGHNTERQCSSNSPANIFTEHFEDALATVGGLGPLHHFSNDGGHQDQTNTWDQSEVPQRSDLPAQQSFPQVQQSTTQHDGDILRGVTNHAEHTGSIRASRETRGAQQRFPAKTTASSYNVRYGSCSVASQRSTVTPMPNPQAASAELAEARSTPYGSYQGRFLTSNAARDHRHLCTRFGRHPYIHPDDDPTIREIEGNRQCEVGRIYDAMIRGDRARDNANSIAMKRWVNCAHYKTDLVEAFAHKVFDCLLVQVKEGFRGWHHNDYVDDDRKGEKEDREADCMGRLKNIIDALEREKTICEDVVNSASQIRMFVNAPIAYAARKLQNRVGNSKRGRTKDTADPNPRPTKARRLGGRQTRARSTTASEVPSSRDTTPQFQTSDMPYYSKPVAQQTTSSPRSSYLLPRQPLHRSAVSMPQVPTKYQQANATSPMKTMPAMVSSTMARPLMSPPALPASHSYNNYVSMMPIAQMSPSMSTPSLAYSYHSSPPSPDDEKHPFSTTSPNTWPDTDAFDSSLHTPMDPSLTTNDLLFSHQAWSDSAVPVEDGGNTNFFDQNPDVSHVSLADIEHMTPQTEEPGTSEQLDFESYWNDQPGVQPFSFDGRHKTGYGHQ